MSKHKKGIVFGVWILLTLAVFGTPAMVGTSLAVWERTTDGPADVYATHCATCHGADGRARTSKGRRAGATDFTSRDWNTDEARGIKIITNGKSEMPRFKGKLTADEIKGVFGYVLGFRQEPSGRTQR